MAEPTVRLTSPTQLVVAALVGGAGSWLLVRVTERVAGEPPTLPWAAVVVLAVLAFVVAGVAVTARRANRPGQPRPDARPAMARLALGKAALLVGVALALGYAVFALLFVGHLDVPAPRERVVRGALAALVSAALAVAGRVLELACRGSWDDRDRPDGERAPGA